MKSERNKENRRNSSFIQFRFHGAQILAYLFVCILILTGCSEKEAAPPAREVSKEVPKTPPPKETETQPSSVVNYFKALEDMERTSGKQSSHTLYFQMRLVSKDQYAESLLNCAQWVLFNKWIDGSTTSSIVIEAIRENQDSFDLLSKGVQIDNPVLPRINGREMLVPNGEKLYTLALLRLAEAKHSAWEKLKVVDKPDISLMEEAEAGLEILEFGSHFMCDNATLIHYLIGNGIRSYAADFLIWLVENDRSFSLDRKDVINRILSHEEKRKAMFKGWYDDLSIFRDIQLEAYTRILPRDPKPEFIDLLRKRLSEDIRINAQALTREQILDIYSTNTLARYFNEYLEAGKAFAELSPAEREKEAEKYEEQARALSPRRSLYLRNMDIPTVTNLLRLEQMVTTKLRMVVSALAIQECIATKRAATPIKSVKALYLDESWAKDPFTDHELIFTYEKADIMVLNGELTPWFYTLAPGYTQNYDYEIIVPIPQSRVQTQTR